MDEERITLTRGELDIRLAVERTIAKQDILIGDFQRHKEDDKIEFGRLGKSLHELREEIETRYVSRKEVRVGYYLLIALQIGIAVVPKMMGGG